MAPRMIKQTASVNTAINATTAVIFFIAVPSSVFFIFDITEKS
jgi:hypothetical protein